MRKIENVPFRCLKCIYNDFMLTHGKLRKRAERPVMYVQRLRAIPKVYKAYFTLVPNICVIFLRNPTVVTQLEITCWYNQNT